MKKLNLIGKIQPPEAAVNSTFYELVFLEFNLFGGQRSDTRKALV